MDKVGSLEVSWIQGASCLEFVDDKTVCYMCGSHICFLDLETKKQRMFHCDVRGIGVLTANSHSGVFVFSEHKLNPSIFVYTFPSLELKNELKGSAQLDYTSLALCDNGPYLSCHSTFPDYTITVWNWEKAEKLCTHENERDVISLEFNPLNWSQFCALGTESVTVWAIEKSEDLHVLKPRAIELPAIEISLAEMADHVGLECGSSVVEAEVIVTELTPTAICWTATSELYVGCEQGFLLLADPETHCATILYNPRSPDATPELKHSKFMGLTLDHDGLIVIGKEDVLHRLKIQGTQITITQTWILESAVGTVKHALDYETFLLSTDTGHFFLLKPHQSDELLRFPWVSSSNFVASAMLRTDKNICLSLKRCGKLQLWSPHGDLLGIMYMKTETKSLACCPVAQCAAIGTASGSVHIIDLSKEDHPRVVHKVHLYHTPVDYLVFDQGGNFLLGTSDRFVHVLHAKPSEGFSVIGFTVVPGSILSLTTQYVRETEQVKVLALCGGDDGRMTDGSLLTVFVLPVKELAGPECVDRNGQLCSGILQVRLYEVPCPIQACVLGINRFFAYCHKKKLIQRFPLPQNIEGVSSKQVVRLTPDQEASGHPLGPASLVLSPHNIWLSSVGRDGLVRIRETSAMEQHIELQCHSYRGGGVKTVSFSADSLTLLTTGFSDGSVVCLFIKITGCDTRIKEATEYSLSMGAAMKSIFDAENRVLTSLPDWVEESPADAKKSEGQPKAEPPDGQHEDEVPPCTPPSNSTWMESRQELVMKEDNEYYSATKESLRKTIKELRETLQEMITENQNLPKMERLKQEEFDMGGEENMILEDMATKLREEIEMKILKKSYLYDIIKREIWDSMTVKYKTIMALHTDTGVKNYPLKEPPAVERMELQRVLNIRKLELATSTRSPTVMQLRESLKKRDATSSREEEELAEGGQEAPCSYLTDTYCDLLGYTNPYIYDQSELTTTERRINQIYMLQDLIYTIRNRFNAEFEVLHKQKLQVINGVRERNKEIREMMLELRIEETLWEPSLVCMEQPEILLKVDDSEIKSERYLNPEEKKLEDERQRLEKEKILAATGDNLRTRALDEMMGGTLEGKKEDVLHMEIPVPEFVSSKAENEWDEDEKKAYEDYEKKTVELDERKEAYKKSLEAELKKLHVANKDSVERFDENLKRLAEKKLKSEVAIYQERLKIGFLINSVLQENKMRQRHQELRLQREKMTAHMNECLEEVEKHEEEVRVFHETYDVIVAQDKVVEQDFNAGFSELPSMMVARIHKLFKRRPRTQKAGAHGGSNPFKERSLRVHLAPDALDRMLEAMHELDHAEHMPEGMNPLLWEQFCHLRRLKVETEHKVKVASLTLAEKQAFLSRRRAEYEEAREEVNHLYDALESLHDEKFNFLMNLTLHVLLKTNQVEVPMMGLQADYSDSILLHPHVLQELNSAIRMLGGHYINALMDYKEVHEVIFRRQCEHRMMDMHIEDQLTMKNSVLKLKLFEEEKDYLNERDRESCLSKQVSSLEKTIAFLEKDHIHNMKELTKKRARLIAKTAQKKRENDLIEQELSVLEVTVAERAHIHEAIGKNQEQEKDDRYWEVLENLKSDVKAHEQELAFLTAERKRMMNKNFPKLPELNQE